MCYFTEQGRQDLIDRRDALVQSYQKLQRELTKNPTRVPQSSSSGNIESHREDLDIQREMGNLDQKIQAANTLIGRVVLIEPPQDTMQLRIGHVATIQRSDENGHAIGAPERYLIGGYQATDMEASPPVLSYDSPLIADLLGTMAEPMGESAVVHLGGKKIYVDLLKIEMPQGESQLKAVA